MARISIRQYEVKKFILKLGVKYKFLFVFYFLFFMSFQFLVVAFMRQRWQQPCHWPWRSEETCTSEG